MTVIRFAPRHSLAARRRSLSEAISRWYRYWNRHRRLYRIAFASILATIAAGGLLHAVTVQTGWSASDVLRHIAAARNCDAARAVGLDQARPGEPGYYGRHDRDKDGIACEVWPRR